MNKNNKLIWVIGLCFVFIGCSKNKTIKFENVGQPTMRIELQNNSDLQDSNNQKDKIEKDFSNIYGISNDPNYWTNEKQKEIYEMLFEKQDLSEVLKFRKFIESLAKYHHDKPLYEYNPIFLCYEKYPENLQFFVENKKELFLFGNINWGDYSESPFLYVVKNNSIKNVKFYFDNEIPVLESEDDVLYGSRNAGGPRFGIGGNILLYTDNEEIRNYLISKGVPSEIDADTDFVYSLTKDAVSIYKNPGFNNPILATITKKENFTAIKVLAYKVDNEQWMKINFDKIEGWIPQSSFDYDTGI